jgi:ribosomal peptide maturation radical SAM protein 1
MGPALLRAFPVIDYVVSGEGEETFPILVKALLSHNDRLLGGLRGISYRDETRVNVNLSAQPITDLDKYPIMDCDDYYQQLAGLSEECASKIERGPIYYECSRGCWWGQHAHCTFCGLNGSNVSFRSKSPERIIKELVHLSKRHKTLSFQATDNIFNPAYFTTLLPKLKGAGFDFSLFFEVKANMTKQQVRMLAQSGVTVQPGIESLSTHVLKLMRKGTTMLQNIQTLKWMEEYGVVPMWKFIGGFPGETEDDYLLMKRVIPLLYHLPPPTPFARITMDRIEMHRFSPNFDFAEEFGFKNVRPQGHYKYLYDLSDDLLRDIAYSFDYELPGYEKLVPHMKRIQQLIDKWDRKYRSYLVELTYGRGPDFLEIEDTRYGSEKHIVLSGYEMEIVLCCDRISSLQMILEWLRSRNESFNENDVTSSIEALIADGLIMEENGKYLSLATAKNPDLETENQS